MVERSLAASTEGNGVYESTCGETEALFQVRARGVASVVRPGSGRRPVSLSC